jgi:hypothetical protein
MVVLQVKSSQISFIIAPFWLPQRAWLAGLAVEEVPGSFSILSIRPVFA